MSETQAFDRYDEQVIKTLQENHWYKGYVLKDKYKEYTEINRDSTAKRRAKNLTSTDAFETLGHGKFLFKGVGVGD